MSNIISAGVLWKMCYFMCKEFVEAVVSLLVSCGSHNNGSLPGSGCMDRQQLSAAPPDSQF